MQEQGAVRIQIALVGRPFAAGVASVGIEATILRSVSSAAAQWATLAGRRVRKLCLLGRPSLTAAEHKLTQDGIKRAAAGGQLIELFNATLQEAPPAFLCQNAASLHALGLRDRQPFADAAFGQWGHWAARAEQLQQLAQPAVSLAGLAGLRSLRSLTLASISPAQLAQLVSLPPALTALRLDLRGASTFALAPPPPNSGGWHALHSLDVGGPQTIVCEPLKLFLRARCITLRSDAAVLLAQGSTCRALAAALVQAALGAAAAADFSSLSATGLVSMRGGACVTFQQEHAPCAELQQAELRKLLEEHHALAVGVDVQTAQQRGGRHFAISVRDPEQPSAYSFGSKLSDAARALLEGHALVSSLRLPACTDAAWLLHHPGFLARNAPSLCALECTLSAGLRLAPYKQLTSLSGFWSSTPAPLPCASALRGLSVLGAPAGKGMPTQATPFTSAWLAGVQLGQLALTEHPDGRSLFPLDLRSLLRLDWLCIRTMESGAVLRLDERAVVTSPTMLVKSLLIRAQGAGTHVSVVSPLFAAAAVADLAFGREDAPDGAAVGCLVVKAPAKVEAVPNSRASPLADALLEALLALPHLGTLKLLWHSCDPSRTPLLKAQGSLGGLPLFQLKAGLEASRFAPCFKVQCSWAAAAIGQPMGAGHRAVLHIERVAGAVPCPPPRAALQATEGSKAGEEGQAGSGKGRSVRMSPGARLLRLRPQIE